MKNEDQKDLALAHIERLRQISREKGLSYGDIAETTGFTHSNVIRMLSGKYIPRYDNLLKLSAAIDVKINLTDQTTLFEKTQSPKVTSKATDIPARSNNSTKNIPGLKVSTIKHTPEPNPINHKALALEQLQRVRRFAKEKGMRDETIAEKMGIGRQGVSRLFSGNNLPRLDTFLKLCDAVGVPIRDVIEDRAKTD